MSITESPSNGLVIRDPTNECHFMYSRVRTAGVFGLNSLRVISNKCKKALSEKKMLLVALRYEAQKTGCDDQFRSQTWYSRVALTHDSPASRLEDDPNHSSQSSSRCLHLYSYKNWPCMIDSIWIYAHVPGHKAPFRMTFIQHYARWGQ